MQAEPDDLAGARDRLGGLVRSFASARGFWIGLLLGLSIVALSGALSVGISEATPNRTCFQSFGRDASGRILQDPARIVRLCALARGFERDCIYGAARDITSMDAGARRSSPFCSRVPASFRAICFNGIGTILGGFHTYAADRRAACRASVPCWFWRDCFAGAGA